MSTSVHAINKSNQEFLSPADFCRQYGHANSTLSKHIHKGEIALHQFSDAPRPKINVSEALRVRLIPLTQVRLHIVS
jgi:hypothetical protein